VRARQPRIPRGKPAKWPKTTGANAKFEGRAGTHSRCPCPLYELGVEAAAHQRQTYPPGSNTCLEPVGRLRALWEPLTRDGLPEGHGSITAVVHVHRLSMRRPSLEMSQDLLDVLGDRPDIAGREPAAQESTGKLLGCQAVGIAAQKRVDLRLRRADGIGQIGDRGGDEGSSSSSLLPVPRFGIRTRGPAQVSQ
jgi:hypothetical protein